MTWTTRSPTPAPTSGVSTPNGPSKPYGMRDLDRRPNGARRFNRTPNSLRMSMRTGPVSREPHRTDAPAHQGRPHPDPTTTTPPAPSSRSPGRVTTPRGEWRRRPSNSPGRVATPRGEWRRPPSDSPGRVATLRVSDVVEPGEARVSVRREG